MSLTKVLLGATVKMDGKEQIVKPPCEQKNNGSWYCVTHDYHATNRWDKDSHISTTGKHVMAWFCNEHGLEVP